MENKNYLLNGYRIVVLINEMLSDNEDEEWSKILDKDLTLKPIDHDESVSISEIKKIIEFLFEVFIRSLRIKYDTKIIDEKFIYNSFCKYKDEESYDYPILLGILCEKTIYRIEDFGSF